MNKEVLVEQLRLGGFEYGSVSRKWAENGYIIRNSQKKKRSWALLYQNQCLLNLQNRQSIGEKSNIYFFRLDHRLDFKMCQ